MAFMGTKGYHYLVSVMAIALAVAAATVLYHEWWSSSVQGQMLGCTLNIHGGLHAIVLLVLSYGLLLRRHWALEFAVFVLAVNVVAWVVVEVHFGLGNTRLNDFVRLVPTLVYAAAFSLPGVARQFGSAKERQRIFR